ncbi:6985_t:CDS:1, partial [Rhizophagus irregularis]
MKLINESAVEEIITEDGVQNSVSSSEIISNKITEELVVVHAALFCQKNDGSLQLSLKFWHSFRE